MGLGNPGRQYQQTRHNVGFRVVEVLARRWKLQGGRKAFSGRLVDARISRTGSASRRVMLLEPHTYMNRSGQAVGALAAFYRIARQDILVVLDDMALPVGRLRIRTGGSSGGHKGLADVLAATGTTELPRLRIGIGSPPPMMAGVDYVLTPFEAQEKEAIGQAIELAAQAAEDWVFDGIDVVMEKYNRRAETEKQNEREETDV